MNTLKLSPKERRVLKQAFQEGFIYQRLQHTCGFVGNSYSQVDGKWARRTHCPQCGELIRWIPIEEWIKRTISKLSEL
jgi:hypothetical protein